MSPCRHSCVTPSFLVAFKPWDKEKGDANKGGMLRRSCVAERREEKEIDFMSGQPETEEEAKTTSRCLVPSRVN
jgi:hypothetical protein